jgi:3-hydroxyisobutyrate dehydrogenase-like beta-hydroxyacid dehydrogenase
MVGGTEADIERTRPVFDTFASSVLHMGPVGSGQVAKLLNNLVFTAQVAVAIETFELSKRLQVDRTALAAVLAAGSGGSTAATIVTSMQFDLAPIRGALPLLRKDVGLMLDVARAEGASEPDVLATLARRTFDALSDEPAPPRP